MKLLLILTTFLLAACASENENKLPFGYLELSIQNVACELTVNVAIEGTDIVLAGTEVNRIILDRGNYTLNIHTEEVCGAQYLEREYDRDIVITEEATYYLYFL